MRFGILAQVSFFGLVTARGGRVLGDMSGAGVGAAWGAAGAAVLRCW